MVKTNLRPWPQDTYVVALSGGIGAGKTAVSNELARRGATVVNADELAREALAPGSAAATAVVNRFGPNILNPTGEIDRAKLAQIIFSDPTQRRYLESQIHPQVQANAAAIFSATKPGTVCVYDYPLLAESGDPSLFDAIIIVTAPTALRAARLEKDRGLKPDDIAARMANQASDEERNKLADFLLDNSASPDKLLAAIEPIWDKLLAAAQEKYTSREQKEDHG